jgi:1,4-dihydroxy-2-naphthoate octaprenyltransferase
MNVQQFLRVVEIRTKIISGSTLALALLYVNRVQGSVQIVSAVLMVIAALLVDMATTAFNSFFDYIHRVDSKETNRESDKVLVHQGVAPGHALIISLGLYVVAGVLGIILTLWHGWIILVLGLASLLVGFLYSGGPYPISRTPFGEVFAGGFLGPILFIITLYTQSRVPNLRDLLATLPSFFHIAAILTVNNTCDIQGDTFAGRKTLSILLGEKSSKILIGILIFLSYGAMGLTIQPDWFLASVWFAGLVLSFHQVKELGEKGYSHQRKGPSMMLISRSFLFMSLTYGILLLLG